MKTVFIQSIGRFPTISTDIGRWINLLENSDEIIVLDLNKKLYESFVSSAIDILIPSLCSELNVRRRKTAGEALQSISWIKTYCLYETYLKEMECYCDYLHFLSSCQSKFFFDLTGVTVNDLDYESTESLCAYAKMDSTYKNFLSFLLEDILNNKIERVVFSAKNEKSLLTALICTQIVKDVSPEIKTCLYNFSYENFTLNHFIKNFEKKGVFLDFFDVIIADSETKDEILSYIINTNYSKKGYVDKSLLGSSKKCGRLDYAVAPVYTSTFTPYPVLGFRALGGGCYWGKCNFCVQNRKHAFKSVVEDISLVNDAVERLEWFVKAGYKYVVFEDEAFSAPFSRALSKELIKRKVPIRWTCRSRVDYAYDAELFSLMKEAGCYEILFGLESANLHVIKLMNKYENFSIEKTYHFFKELSKSGIGAHINILIGFPGETVAEAQETAAALFRIGSLSKKFTYQINVFTLFRNTNVFDNPDKYGIKIESTDKDMKIHYDFEYLTGDYSDINILYDEYWLIMYKIFENNNLLKNEITDSFFEAYSIANDSGLSIMIKDWDYICKFL